MPDDRVARESALTPADHFSEARRELAPGVRREKLVERARSLHEELMSRPSVSYYRSCDLVKAPYPTRFALREAVTPAQPYVHIFARLFIVQFETSDGLKTLLSTPVDIDGSRETPFFRRLADSLPVKGTTQKLVAPISGTVEDHLQALGIRPDQVDYITYDHLHTQDIRRWLGTGDTPGYFPRAKLLVREQELASARALTAPQRDWYPPDGTTGVLDEKILTFDQDLWLGKSVLLMATPGHTEGNQSLVVRTPEGVLVTSENGVSADSYAPAQSRMRGLKQYANDTGMDIVLNGNTLEGGLDQYLSMVVEREVAGPSKRFPGFPNFVPSSEMTPTWLCPALRPTVQWGELEFGEVHGGR